MKTVLHWHRILFILLLFCLSGCNNSPSETEDERAAENTPVFTLIAPDSSNIHFQNTLTEGPNTNVLMYEYLYNGGGVAAADFNGDDLIDLYFSSNMGDNKCYLNLGNMKFQDVTDISGTAGRPGPWKTGITAADVNGDGRLDLYLCYSGALPPNKRANQLFINTGNNADGVPLFVEKSAEYGLDSEAFSNQGYFFDYDRDGDLDMLLLNHNPKSLPVLNVASTKEFLKKDDPLMGIRLYQQENGHFNDVTVKAGISGSGLSYGLGIGISDLNDDGWPDFYVSNDYAVPDYLYINRKDGTFSDQLREQLGHTSHFSMGNDIADINNDGLQDIITLDMLPEDNRRQKLLLAPDNYDKFDLNVRSGFHYQYMRNMLHLNNGEGSFSEIGQLAGISNTDWSWAALLADYNNDGWKDLFVTNGYYRDYTNLDFINYMEDYMQSKGRLLRQDVLEIVKKMPSSNLTNYFFANLGDGTFTNETDKFGLNEPANSNGAAYADLDNDGDLDLVVNNINTPAFLYRNDSPKNNRHYLQLKLQGQQGNTQGIGARVTLYQGNSSQSSEQMPTRGYLSTVSTVLHFGLGENAEIDSLGIRWNNGACQTLTEVAPDRLLVLQEGNAREVEEFVTDTSTFFAEVPSPISYVTSKSDFNDFKRQSLLIAQFSHSAPCMAQGDLNGDGLSDIFVGGAKDQAGAVFLQQANGSFKKLASGVLDLDKDFHDGDAAILDADGDGHLDVYVSSGGYHDLSPGDPLLQDRLYFGDGKGNLRKDIAALPKMLSSSTGIAVGDLNRDGSPDLFVGGRVVPGRYPETPQSYLLVNDGKGHFKDVAGSVAPGLGQAGMVTDASWADLDNDGQQELIVIGEWMPVTVYGMKSGKFTDITSTFFPDPSRGWWNTLALSDLNGDGRPDFVVGNMGTNTQFQVSAEEPAEMHYADFDENGSVDPILSFFIQGKSYPYLTRDELLGQLAPLRSKFTTYAGYAEAGLQDIFDDEKLKKAKKLSANHLSTTLFLSTADGTYRMASLPPQAQYAPVYQITYGDFNADGHEDIILLGNNGFFKLRLGRFDANYGTLLLGDGSGKFEYVPQSRSGLFIKGDVRSALRVQDLLFLGIYGEEIKAVRIIRSENQKTNESAINK